MKVSWPITRIRTRHIHTSKKCSIRTRSAHWQRSICLNNPSWVCTPVAMVNSPRWRKSGKFLFIIFPCYTTKVLVVQQIIKKFFFRLSKMFNTGLRDRQIKYWSSRKPQCTLDTLSTRSISIYETAPALVLLAFGVLIGGIICFIENMIYYRFMRWANARIYVLACRSYYNFARREEMPRPLNNDDAEATASTSKHNLSEWIISLWEVKYS